MATGGVEVAADGAVAVAASAAASAVGEVAAGGMAAITVAEALAPEDRVWYIKLLLM
jgi:hypothetical protein